MTLLIKNGRLVDGVRDFPDRSDIFVANGVISAIGDFPNKRADEILDAQGLFVSPGFIDVNTGSDHYLTLLNHPGQGDFLAQGVTTIFGGMCGSSLAPLLYGGLESVRKWSNTENVNLSWHTVSDFLKALDALSLGVNFGTLAGHATIRRAIIGEAIRDMTKNEREVSLKVLRRAFDDGAFGLSTGLGYVHGRKTPESEITSLARAVKDVDGVYATHLRNSGAGIDGSVDEVVRLARHTGVRTLISHFVPEIPAAKDYEAALAAIDAIPHDMDLRFDIYPFPETLAPLYTFLPQWTQTGGWEAMLPNLNDAWFLSRIKKDFAAIDEDAFIVAQAPGNDILVGRSLRDLKDMFEVSSAEDALVRLMVATGLRSIILYRNLDASLMRKALAHPRSFIASNAPSFDVSLPPLRLKTDRTTSTFTKFLALVEDEGIMTVKEAVGKISSEPAHFFGLAGRGELREGAIADIACFKGSDIRFTIVNGRIAFRSGELQNKTAGKGLRHH